jgi:hypothetical protein
MLNIKCYTNLNDVGKKPLIENNKHISLFMPRRKRKQRGTMLRKPLG